MTIKKILITAILFILPFLSVTETLSARDWDDLYEEDGKVFGSEKEMKYNPDMFFLQREIWEGHYSFMLFWLFKYTDYPKYSSTRLFPLYHTLESKIDNRRYSFIPITLTYWETDGNEKYRINPLFVSGHSSDSNGWEDNYSVSWLHGYFYTKRPSTENPERTWWAPIIPLIYRSTDNWGGHMNVGWLLDYSWSRDKDGGESLKRFWMMPLLFHRPGSDGYTHMLPPVFLYNRHSNGEYWVSLLPLFKRSKDIKTVYNIPEKKDGKRYRYEYQDSFKSLIYCYNSVYNDKWEGEKTLSEFWFPAIPLFYSYEEKGVESHRNLLWVIDWHNNAEGVTDRLWFAPFYFSRDDAYRHILPPLYMSFPGSEDDSYSHLIPFYISSRSLSEEYDPASGKSIPVKERLLLTPLSGYSSAKAAEGGSGFDSVSYWFPILPLYYHSEWSEGTHTNLLWAFDWGRNKEGALERFFFIPFVFHETGEGGYRVYLPFYYRPSGWSGTEGVAYSPLYYHRWSPEEDTKWSWLIHYKRSNSTTGEYLNTWVPFYYHHNEPGSGETTWVFPAYYHHDSLGQKGYFARVAAPFYWNIETSKRDTTLFLPLYFETEKKNGTGSRYINILGYSRSVLSGTNPVIDASLGTNQRGVYIDIDVSWLIEMVSLSTRVTVPMKSGEEEIYEEESSGEIILSKKNRVSRDTSTNFWGVHALYGLFAFEKADSKRHLRILPLSWLTWDENSDDRIKVILNYVSYKEEETEYLVFFPFYGYQRVGESYSKGYLLNAYWKEYDHEEQMHEHTVLWPLINWYSSPAKSGWRVLPAVWHKNRTEGDVLHSSTYTPLYLNLSREDTNDSSTLYRLNMSPLHFYRYSKEEDETSKIWFSSIPLIFHKENRTVSRYKTPAGSDTPREGAETPETGHEYISADTLKWLFPLYLVSREETSDRGTGVTTDDYTLFGLPLLYYHSLTEKSSDPDSDEKKRGELFIMGYYSEFSSESNSSSILFGLYESEKYPGSGDYSYSLLYGLFNVSDTGGNYENYFRPFYYYGNDNGSREHSALMGLYRKKDDSSTGNSCFSLLYGMFSTSLHNYTVDPDNKSIPLQTKETWLIPAFYYSSTESSAAEKPWRENLSLSPLHYRYDADRGYGREYTFWAPVIPLYYHSEDGDGSHTNILWLLDYGKGKNGELSRLWLLPVYYSRGGDDGYFHLAPLYFSYRDRKNEDYTRIICGLYLNSNREYTRENFLYLYDHTSYKTSDYDEYSLLFTTFELEISPEIKEMRAFWGWMLDARWEKNGYDIEGLLYLAAIEREGGYFHTRVIPFWYYESREGSHTLVIPPALTWDSSDSDGSRFQLWALGSIWYRDYEPRDRSDLQAALLGIPYYKVQRAERGYESWGSLWGLLWEYETESETGFSKFSLLKFIYKRVEMDGDVQHRVLGITL